MKNLVIALGAIWMITIFLATVILRSSIYVYNIFFLLLISAITNICLVCFVVVDEKKPRKKK